jgi:bifunctional UDP-N-acetylglucosamine pyrophosphorylase / glucosamine-1-phosphate N-acetyltransferase
MPGGGAVTVVVLPAAGSADLLAQPLSGRVAEDHLRAAAGQLGGARVAVAGGRDGGLPLDLADLDGHLTGPAGHRVVLVAADAALLTADTIRDLIARHVVGGFATALRAGIRDDEPRGRDWIESHVLATVAAADAERHPVAWALEPDAAKVVLAELAGAPPGDPIARLAEAVRAQGWPVSELIAADWRDAVRVRDAIGFSYAGRVLQERILRGWMLAGVQVVDPASTWIDAGVVLHPGVVLQPRTHLAGTTTVEAGAQVGPDVLLTDTRVGESASVRYAVCEGAELGPATTVGPYVYLRRDTRLAAGAGVGCFVEMKDTRIGEGTIVGHFACLIDGDIGQRSVVAAFSGTANFDGVVKRRAVIGDDVLIGAATAVLAPARIGDGATTATGTVVTRDVPPGAMAIARVSQVNVEGWVAAARRRGK